MPIDRTKEREIARELRLKKRMSIESIAKELNVSKGSVSVWLRDIPLTPEEKHSRYVENGKNSKFRIRKLTPKIISSKFFNWVKKPLNNNQKGKIAESAAILRLTVLQYNVYKSVFDGEKIDIVTQTLDGMGFLKLQVRWAFKAKHGSSTISITCSNGRRNSRRYQDNEFDFIIGYEFETDTCYVYSKNDIKHLKRQVSLNESNKEAWDKLLI